MGHRLLAVDGTDFWTTDLLFDQVHEHCMQWREKTLEESSKGAYENSPSKFKASYLYDVLNGVILDQCMEMPDGSEREMASRLFSQLEAGDIITFDRGYPAAWLFSLIIEYKAFFCCRLPIAKECVWQQEFIKSGELETVHHFTLNAAGEALNSSAGGSGVVGEAVPFRVIRVDLPNDEVELLATNLDPETFGAEVFGELLAGQ